MRISDWSSDVRSGELDVFHGHAQPGSLSDQSRRHRAGWRLGIGAAVDAQIAAQVLLEHLSGQAVIAGAAIRHVVTAHRLGSRSNEDDTHRNTPPPTQPAKHPTKPAQPP